MTKIKTDNRALTAEVDNFKNTETAKKITTAYEAAMQDLEKVFEPQQGKAVPNRDMGSVYTFLYHNPDTKELAKRLLLDTCFLEETKQRVVNMPRSEGIVAKIAEKAGQRQSLYPRLQQMWLSEHDLGALEEHRRTFREKHLSGLI